MTINEINGFIVAKYPLSKQEKWDESGIRYVHNKAEQATGILLCLDLSEEVIDFALKTQINFIISHHPIFLKNKEAKPTQYELNLLRKLKDNKISFASYHTNVDNSSDGLNFYIAKQLDLGQIKVVPGTGIVTGKIKFAYRPKVFASTIKNTFDLERIIYTSEELIRNVAICSGAGFGVFKQNLGKLKDIDLFITGDVKWHDWQFAKVHNMNVMDVGHDLENVFIDVMTKLINSKIKLIKIQTVPNRQDIKIVT